MLGGYLKMSLLCGALALGATVAQAQSLAPPPTQEPSTVEEIRAALFGGVPDGRWKEGLLFEGVRPMPWLGQPCRLTGPWLKPSTSTRCNFLPVLRSPISKPSN